MFNEGGSGAPWKIGWGVGNFRVTTDPELVHPGEPTAAIVTVNRKYASLQQDVVGQLQLMGNGQYLFKVYMRAFDRPIDTSYLKWQNVIMNIPQTEAMSRKHGAQETLPVLFISMLQDYFLWFCHLEGVTPIRL